MRVDTKCHSSSGETIKPLVMICYVHTSLFVSVVDEQLNEILLCEKNNDEIFRRNLQKTMRAKPGSVPNWMMLLLKCKSCAGSVFFSMSSPPVCFFFNVRNTPVQLADEDI